MNLETKITIYKFTPQLFTLTPAWHHSKSSEFQYKHRFRNYSYCLHPHKAQNYHRHQDKHKP